MEEILGSELPVFIGLTIILFGGGAFMMGQAVAETWRPWKQIIPYGLMMGVGNRLLANFLFASDMLSIPGYISNTIVLIAIALLAFRLRQARKMVSQYPWLYERAGAFGWRDAGRN